MANKLYEETDIQNIADAIREKTGSDATMTVSQMAMEIEGISTEGGLVGTELTQAEYDALPEEEQNTGLYFITDGDATTGVDYIVEQDMSGIWTYRKWNSGIAECWGVYEFQTLIKTAFGGMYYSDPIQVPDYPFAFVEVPICQFVPHISHKTYFIDGGNKDRYTSDGTVIKDDLKNGPPACWLYRPEKYEDSNWNDFSIACRVLGRWK